MATTVTKIIDPDNGSGTDYTSLSAWEAGEQGDLTGVRDEIAVAKCRCTNGTADTTAVVIDGWTTSATQYIKIWTDPAEEYRHSGKWVAGNKYRIENIGGGGSGTGVINISDNYVTVEGLQVYLTSGSAPDRAGISLNGSATNSIISACIIKANTADESTIQGIRYHNAGSTHLAKNCLIYDFEGTSESGWVYGISEANANLITLLNITIVNCRGGIYAGSSMQATNCLCEVLDTSNERAFRNFNAGSVDYCACNHGDTYFSGTGNRTSQTFSFVDAANDDYHLASTDAGAKGYGTNLYNHATYAFQDDIVGTDRGGSGASWDIGAFEYVAAAAAGKPYYYHANQ